MALLLGEFCGAGVLFFAVVAIATNAKEALGFLGGCAALAALLWGLYSL